MAATTMTSIADEFFQACETGQGWDGCSSFCTPGAAFQAQAEPLAGIASLRDYTEWMKGLLAFMPNGRYEIKSFATDNQRQNVCVYGVFSATHTGKGGPMPPTGRSTTSDYVYVMQFEGGKIAHLTKIWNAPWAMKELGWGQVSSEARRIGRRHQL